MHQIICAANPVVLDPDDFKPSTWEIGAPPARMAARAAAIDGIVPELGGQRLSTVLTRLAEATRDIEQKELELAWAKRERGLWLTVLKSWGDEVFMSALEGMKLALETARGEMWVARQVPEEAWKLGFSYSALKAAAALPEPEMVSTLTRLASEGRTTVSAVNQELRQVALAEHLGLPPREAGPVALEAWLEDYALREWAGRLGPQTAKELASSFCAATREWAKENGRGGTL